MFSRVQCFREPSAGGYSPAGPAASGETAWSASAGFAASAFPGSAGPVAVASPAAAAARAALGRLRTDSRVTASMNATPSAASPASCASMTGVPIGIALEFATRWATSRLPGLLPFGAGVGTADEFTVVMNAHGKSRTIKVDIITGASYEVVAQ